MSTDGRLRVFVRSRKVPVRTIEFSRPLYSASGVLVGMQTSRALLYAQTFDDSHRKAIEEARKLSCTLGLEFEVVDKSRSNPLRRIIYALAGDRSAEPSLALTPLSGAGARGTSSELQSAPR